MATKKVEETIEERMARVEERTLTILDRQDAEVDKVQKMEGKLDVVLSEMARYKGFIGGIIFIAACIGAFLKTFPLIGSIFGNR